MSKMNIFFLILIILIMNSSSITTIKLEDLKKTSFSLKNHIAVFEYENNERIFNSSINFIFSDQKKSSTKIYICESLDKVYKVGDKLTGCLYETTFDSNNYIKISYDDDFYKDNWKFYLLLYDSSKNYDDSVYVVNSLKYLNFNNEITFSSNFAISFNFLIEKDTPTYLHYQARPVFYKERCNYINITNEKGEELINNYFGSEVRYIKIEPNVKYYAHLKVSKDSDGYTRGTFSLKYEKYKNNILLKDETKVSRPILIPQNYKFFKSISNATMDDSIIINGDYSGINGRFYIYFKKYESDDFESLVDSFPTDTNGYDDLLGEGLNYKSFTHIIQKGNDSQKGLLIGYFVISRSQDIPFDFGNISLGVNIVSHTDNKNPSSEAIIVDTQKKSLPVGWVIFIVIISLIIVAIAIWVIVIQKKKRDKRRNNLLQNDFNNISNNSDNCKKVTQLYPSDGNYNYTSGNNDNDGYYHKMLPNEENVGDDLSACPPVSEN